MNAATNLCPHHGGNCEGWLYLAINEHTGCAKPGFTHSARNLNLRARELRPAGFAIVWNTGPRDANGIPWVYSDEQHLHALLRTSGIRPYTGAEWYELTRPLITVIDDLIWARCPVSIRRAALRKSSEWLRAADRLAVIQRARQEESGTA